MSDLTAALAGIMHEHRLGIREWADGYRRTSCMCPEEVGANSHNAHVANLQVAYLREHLADHAEELGLGPERGTNLLGTPTVRYVTDWSRDA